NRGFTFYIVGRQIRSGAANVNQSAADRPFIIAPGNPAVTVLAAEAQAATGPLERLAVVLMAVPEPRNTSFVANTRKLIGRADVEARQLAAESPGQSDAASA